MKKTWEFVPLLIPTSGSRIASLKDEATHYAHAGMIILTTTPAGIVTAYSPLWTVTLPYLLELNLRDSMLEDYVRKRLFDHKIIPPAHWP